MFFTSAAKNLAARVVAAPAGSLLRMNSHADLGAVTMLKFLLEDVGVKMRELDYEEVRGMGDNLLNKTLKEAARQKEVVVITNSEKAGTMASWFDGHMNAFTAEGGKAVVVRYD